MKFFTFFIFVILVFKSLGVEAVCRRRNECICRDDISWLSAAYKGSKSVTANGLLCQPWSINDSYSETHRFCRGYEPHGEIYGPWCYVGFGFHPSDGILWEPCFATCEDLDRQCYYDFELPLSSSFDYLGNKFLTVSEKQCSPWPDEYLIPSSQAVCRAFPTPGSDHGTFIETNNFHRPWCFTSAATNEWEYCYEFCEEEVQCSVPEIAQHISYRGAKSSTLTGRKCQRWDSRWPHEHHYPPFEHNLCRNPTKSALGPFCLTENFEIFGEPCFANCDEDRLSFCVGFDKLIEYNGKIATTIENIPCERWDHYGTEFSPKDFGTNTMWEVSNFCRNPDADPDGPWCFIIDGTDIARGRCFLKCPSEGPNFGRNFTKTEWDQLAVRYRIDQLQFDQVPMFFNINSNKWILIAGLIICGIVVICAIYICLKHRIITWWRRRQFKRCDDDMSLRQKYLNENIPGIVLDRSGKVDENKLYEPNDRELKRYDYMLRRHLQRDRMQRFPLNFDLLNEFYFAKYTIEPITNVFWF